jgi:AAHS family benzoate transporter-like MFS transporter
MNRKNGLNQAARGNIDVLTLKNIISTSKFGGFHIALILLGLLVTAGEGYNLFLYGAVLPLLAEEWGLTEFMAGVIGSCGLLGMMFGAIIFGAAAGKFGKKRTLMLAVLLFSIFTFLGGTAAGPLVFSFFRFCCGLGLGGALPNIVALVTDYAPGKLQKAMVSIMLCGIQIGGLLGPAVSLLTLEKYGWRATLWLGGATIILLPFLQKFLPEAYTFLLERERETELEILLRKIRPERNFDISTAAAQIKTVVTEPETRADGASRYNMCAFLLVFFMTLLLIYGLGTWLPELMIRGGNSLGSSLVFLIFLNCGSIICTFPLAALAEMWRPRVLLVIIYALGAVLLISLGFPHSPPFLYAAVFFLGACTHGAQNLANAYVSQYYPPETRSGKLGLCNGIGRVGAIFGMTFWGFLLQQNLPLRTIYIIFAVPSLLAGLGFVLLRKEK